MRAWSAGVTLFVMSLCLSSCGWYHAYLKQYVDPVSSANIAGAGGGGVIGASKALLADGRTAMTKGLSIGGLLGSQALIQPKVVIARLEKRGVNVVRNGEALDIILPSDLIFEAGDADVKLAAHRTLHDVAILLFVYSTMPIDVVGHSDDIGNFEQKLTLSQQRAHEVACFLWEHGVPKLRFKKIFGVADHFDLADFDTASGRADNRVVVISTRKNAKRFDIHWPI